MQWSCYDFMGQSGHSKGLVAMDQCSGVAMTPWGRVIIVKDLGAVIVALSRRHASLGVLFLGWKQLEYITGYDFRPKSELDSETLVSLTIRSILIEWIGSS